MSSSLSQNGILPTDEQILAFWRQVLPDDNNDVAELHVMLNEFRNGMTVEQRTRELEAHASLIRGIFKEFDITDSQQANQILIDRQLAKTDEIAQAREKITALLQKRRNRLRKEEEEEKENVTTR